MVFLTLVWVCSNPGLICPTDGHNYMKTPGYFGHIVLARPVFYIQYLSSVLRILRMVCFKCGKLLISKEKYAKLTATMSSEEKFNYIFSGSKQSEALWRR